MLYQLDIIVFRWLNSWAGTNNFFDWAIRFRATWFIYFIVIGIILLVLFSFLPKFRRSLRRNFNLLLFAGLSSLGARFVVTEIIRLFYDRPRPFEVLEGVRQLVEHGGGNSFPSGHAAFVFAIAAAVAYYYPKTSILFFIAALSVGVGRVAAGIHWPIDILGGVAVGVLTAWLLGKTFKIKERKNATQ